MICVNTAVPPRALMPKSTPKRYADGGESTDINKTTDAADNAVAITLKLRGESRSAKAPQMPLPNAPESAITLTAPAATAGEIFTSVK